MGITCKVEMGKNLEEGHIDCQFLHNLISIRGKLLRFRLENQLRPLKCGSK